MKMLPSEQTKWAKYKGDDVSCVLICNLGPRPKKIRKAPLAQGPISLCFVFTSKRNKQNKNDGNVGQHNIRKT